MTNAVWEYLRIQSGQSVGKLWNDLTRLRRLGMKYEDLPADLATFRACLDALLAQGRAEKVGELWLATFTQVVEAKPKRQRQESLFA
jgi:hypothetical protein